MSYIYKILNLTNNKIYIGSTNNYKKRFREHKIKLKHNKHHSIFLQNAYNKYGIENFEYIIIEECPKEIKLNREQFYMDSLNPEYNMSINSSSPMEGKKHSAETIAKFKNITRPKGNNHFMYGKTWNEEQRKNILNARLNSNYKHSESTKNKMAETSKRLNRGDILLKYTEAAKLKVIDSNGIIHSSLGNAAKYYNISVQAVCDNLKGRSKKTRIGVIFKYV
jgi:group I intron endonuclease